MDKTHPSSKKHNYYHWNGMHIYIKGKNSILLWGNIPKPKIEPYHVIP